jgi:type IV pilus assembly protein PilP
MKWSSMSVGSVRQLDWRQPWGWPRAFQNALFVGAGVLGVLLLSPWWLHSWHALDETNAAQAKLLAQQQATLALRVQTAQLLQTQSKPQASLADAAVLTQLAQKQGLKFSELGMDKPQQTNALNALHLQQLPVHLKVQGSWDGWLNWLAQWPTAAPGVTVASLELKADPRGGISAQVLAVAPQSTAIESAFELASVSLDSTAATDPFNAQAWASAQRAHAEQHPSYTRLVVPELLRTRDVLETFPRERLQYVGQIASNSEVEALVKVLPATGEKKDAQIMNVYRVRLGQRLGQDFGKVMSVEPDQLVVQELALMPTGEWQTREVRLPLHEAAP